MGVVGNSDLAGEFGMRLGGFRLEGVRISVVDGLAFPMQPSPFAILDKFSLFLDVLFDVVKSLVPFLKVVDISDSLLDPISTTSASPLSFPTSTFTNCTVSPRAGIFLNAISASNITPRRTNASIAPTSIFFLGDFLILCFSSHSPSRLGSAFSTYTLGIHCRWT